MRLPSVLWTVKAAAIAPVSMVTWQTLRTEARDRMLAMESGLSYQMGPKFGMSPIMEDIWCVPRLCGR
jgi:hypothetical protein